MWPKYQAPDYPYPDSRSVPWQLTNETFSFMGTSFAVVEGKDIVRQKAHPILALPIEPLRHWLLYPSDDKELKMLSVAIDWSEVPKVNLTIPVLVAHLPTSALPIDGWHRIARAVQLGLPHLPCVLLGKRDTRRIQF